MKIYNYSDQPVYVHGVAYDGHIEHLYLGIQRYNVVHNNRHFINSVGTERNAIYTITNTNTGYKYKIDYIDVPNVFPYVGLFVAFFGFMLVVRLIQKIKSR